MPVNLTKEEWDHFQEITKKEDLLTKQSLIWIFKNYDWDPKTGEFTLSETRGNSKHGEQREFLQKLSIKDSLLV